MFEYRRWELLTIRGRNSFALSSFDTNQITILYRSRPRFEQFHPVWYNRILYRDHHFHGVSPNLVVVVFLHQRHNNQMVLQLQSYYGISHSTQYIICSIIDDVRDTTILCYLLFGRYVAIVNTIGRHRSIYGTIRIGTGLLSFYQLQSNPFAK